MAPRLTIAGLALAGAAAFAIVSTAAATDPTSAAAATGRLGWLIPGVLSLAALALLAIGLGLAGQRSVLLAIGLLGAAWLVGLPASSTWRSLSAPAGGWLLGVAELACWSIDLRVPSVDATSVYTRRAASIAALVSGATVLALVPELDLPATQGSGLELTIAGLLAAASLLAVAAAMAWRMRDERGSPPPDLLA
jgi:hypothetical protein